MPLTNSNLYYAFLQVVEDGYEFFAKRQLVTLFSAPNYCGEFDNAGGMMSVDETLMCSFQVNKLASFSEKSCDLTGCGHALSQSNDAMAFRSY